eukprot:COSAG01_NODE_601_length_14954_cov_175.954359_11_plen_56_part_00
MRWGAGTDACWVLSGCDSTVLRSEAVQGVAAGRLKRGDVVQVLAGTSSPSHVERI